MLLLRYFCNVLRMQSSSLVGVAGVVSHAGAVLAGVTAMLLIRTLRSRARPHSRARQDSSAILPTTVMLLHLLAAGCSDPAHCVVSALIDPVLWSLTRSACQYGA